MDLSIIIVHWNSEEFTRRCVSSIVDHVQGLDYEIIVLDNGSTDGSHETLRVSCSRARLLHSDKNLGFARANNSAYEHSSGRCVLFLNPDTEIVSPAINLMYSYLMSNPGAGAVGCRLLNADGSVQTSCVQRIPTIVNQLTDIEWLRLRLPRLSFWGIQALFDSGQTNSTEVEAVSGACVMIRREVFETVGRFSTDYFMYGEDLDLSYKVRKAGWKVCHLSGGTIVHYGGRSTRGREESGFRVVVMRESVFRFLEKTRGRSYAWAYRLSLPLAALPRFAACPFLLLWSSLSNRTSPWNTMKKWYWIVRWSFGLEGWSARLNSSQSSLAVEKS
jgi:N-acetylglucosaminyl-diphospho-decaprenol L-rhamnosyltransferase